MQNIRLESILADAQVQRFLETSGLSVDEARTRIGRYLDELRTKQRYWLYRRLQRPVRMVLRSVDPIAENIEAVREATLRSRVVYASNHRSHADYLVEPLVLEQNRIRPPVIAAGVNLFAGPMGLLHRQVTGAVPIRRGEKDPAYLVTLKAYVGQLLSEHDLLFYPEGGRSYSGEFKPSKTGLMHSALLAHGQRLLVIPTAISYDLVLEDRTLARQRTKGAQRPFSAEVVEMLRHGFGYRSRAFVTFAPPIDASGVDPSSRSAVLEFTRMVMVAAGRAYKVLPSAITAACVEPSMTLPGLKARIEALLEKLRIRGANLGFATAGEAVEEGIRALELRGALVVDGQSLRVRDHHLLRYYGNSLNHLLSDR